MSLPVVKNIGELKIGDENTKIYGRVASISNTKEIVTKNRKKMKLANITIVDNTGEINITLWQQHLRFLKKIEEGDVVVIKNAIVQEDYQGKIALQMNFNSSINRIVDESFDEKLPPFIQPPNTPLYDICDEGIYNIQSRIIGIQTPRTIEKPNKTLKVSNLKLWDGTGNINYTLWNNDIKLIESLDLHENDTIQIRRTRASMYNDQISLGNTQQTRIIKRDFDIPEYTIEYDTIENLEDGMTDINILGVVSKAPAIKTFDYFDGTTGKIRTVEIKDDTDTIKITLWNADTEIDMNKGDIIKIMGANVNYDSFNEANILNLWNANMTINPMIDEEQKVSLQALVQTHITPLKDLENLEEDMEVTVAGRILSKTKIRTIPHIDGGESKLQTITIGDNTGIIDVTLWNDNINQIRDIHKGSEIKIEDSRVYIGERGMTVKLTRDSRIVQTNIEGLFDENTLRELYIPSTSIDTIDSTNWNNKTVYLYVLLNEPLRKFPRRDGSDGYVRTAWLVGKDSNDKATQLVKLTLWDNDAKTWEYKDTLLVFENLEISKNTSEYIEAKIGKLTGTDIWYDENPLEDKHEFYKKYCLKKTPAEIQEELDEIEFMIVEADINDVKMEDIHINICPECGKKVEYDTDDELYVCNTCGDVTDTPDVMTKVTINIADKDNSIKATFFNEAAKKILKEVFIAGSYELDELYAKHVQVVCSSYYDEYNDEMALNIKDVIEITEKELVD